MIPSAACRKCAADWTRLSPDWSVRWRNLMRDSLIKLMPWMGGKGQLMWAIQMLLPIHYKTLVDVFGGSGIITLNTAVPKGCLQIYNDLNHDLYNLLFCVKHRPMALTKELSFLPINARDEFDVLRRQLQGEDFTQLYLDEELQLAEQMFPPPEAEEVKRLLQSRAELSDVRRAAAIYKLQRYSYNGNGDSYGVSSCDIQRFFRDIWECSHRLKDVALENKDFESIISTHNDPQTTVYCDPPYYEAERYAVEFPRSDHQRLHDVLVKHEGFAMVSYNNCDYIRRLYEDFFIYEVERPNSQSKKKNDIYREYIMTNYDPRVFASQMTIFGDYSSDGKICRLVHIPERPLRT
ncbi:MAG: DNA adenine methylase [Clostridiales bacterium]|nr:DNA adenine methylase [Clostridiales bacterium]